MSRALYVLAVVFCSMLLLGGITTTDLIRNEGLRARLASEALASGDWLVPTLSGEPHLSKPPGMSLLIVLCSLPAGRVTDVTARLPSVIAAAVTLALWAWTFRRLCGPRTALVALVVMPCSWLWLDRVPSAEIDLVQLAWVSGAMLFVLRAVEADSRSPRPASVSGVGSEGAFWWLASMMCVAGGLFTKWTAPAFFYLTALPWLLWRGRSVLLLRWPHLVGACLVAALAIGWLWLAGASAGWQTLTDTLRREALLRFSPGHHPRPYPWDELLTFPLSFVLGCLPWSLIALVSLRPAFVRSLDEPQRRLWQLCQCWLWVNLLFWTLAPGHRPRHVLPVQPAVAALAVLVWHGWLTGRLRWPPPGFCLFWSAAILRRSVLLYSTAGVRPVGGPTVREGVASPSTAKNVLPDGRACDGPQTERRGCEESPHSRTDKLLSGPVVALMTLLVCWLIVKLIFVVHVLPSRQAERRPRDGGETLAALVPRGQALFLLRLKDDGVLFYYGRPTVRLESPQTLPVGGWCLATETEWRDWPTTAPVEPVAELLDGQGDKLLLLHAKERRP